MKLVLDHAASSRHRKRRTKSRARVTERMKLSAFTAGVDMCRQVAKQLLVELSPEKIRVQLVRIDAGNDRANSARDHLACQRGSCLGRGPDREQGMYASLLQLPDAVRANVLEKEVAKGHVGDTSRPRVDDGARHQALIFRVRARIGQWNG